MSKGSEGGNSHQRAVAKKEDTPVPKSAPLPEVSAKLSLTTDRFLNVLAIILGVVLAFIGLMEVFPLWLNVLVYLIGLVFALWGGWRWETAKKWSASKKIWLSAFVSLAYCALLVIPVKKQYERETNIKLTFKDSPHLTWLRRRIITYDLVRFRDFLDGLGIHIPQSVPPIEVSNSSGLGTGTPPGLPLYRSDLSIGKDLITDRRAVTEVYADYTMQSILGKAMTRTPYARDLGIVMMAGDGFSNYFVQSYWNADLPRPSFPPANILWEIRRDLGAMFTDRLAAAALNTMADDPTAEDNDMYAYFVRSIMIGDSVVESQCDKWGEIHKSLLKSGVSDRLILSQDMSKVFVSTVCLEEWKK